MTWMVENNAEELRSWDFECEKEWSNFREAAAIGVRTNLGPVSLNRYRATYDPLARIPAQGDYKNGGSYFGFVL